MTSAIASDGAVGSARAERRSLPRAALYALLLIGAAAISGFTILRRIDPFDEGLMLQAAERIADGQVPYSDFLWAYGPGQPYLLAGVRGIFGPSLLDWRLLRVLIDAGVALSVFTMIRPAAGMRWALAGWLVAACAMAQPASANPFPLALLLALGAVGLAARGERRPSDFALPAAAGALAGLAAIWRPDFGAFALVAALAAFACASPARPWRSVAALAGAALGVVLVAYLPFLVTTGPADLWEALVAKSLREGDYWSLPLTVVSGRHLDFWGPKALASDLKDLLGDEVAILLLVGLAAAAVATAVAWRRERRAQPLWVGLVVLGAGMALYLHSRPDEFHTQPLAVVLAVLAPLQAAWWLSGVPPRSRAAGGAVALVLVAFAASGTVAILNRVSALVSPPTLARVHVDVADGVRATPREAAALPRVVGLVRRLVPPGEPMYVAPRRSDLVRFNAPILYVLAQRPNPLPDDFGLQALPAAQHEIVRTLERTRPRAVVRWIAPISSESEPNLRGVPSGSHELDEYLARAYRPVLHAWPYIVLQRR